ncbi:MAG TPA: hypothetical protein VFH55_05030 [Nitrospiria bacterium]|nr:hypothetical protein [Nitrospiria bacterium]
MQKIFMSFIVVSLVLFGSWATAQTGGGYTMGDEGHRYGMMTGYLWWWGLYGLFKAAIVLFGLWLLYRIAVAVEKIAASKP